MIDAQIGKFYLVPCVLVPYPFWGESWIPVIGPKHQDHDIGVTWDHFHIDWRFVPKRFFDRCTERVSNTPHSQVISNDSTNPHLRNLSGKTQLRRLKCRREMPDFPQSPNARWVGLEEAQRKRCSQLKHGHICPHRGIDLRPFAKPDGTAICPGHGLRWDLKTGQMLPRHTLPVRAETVT